MELTGQAHRAVIRTAAMTHWRHHNTRVSHPANDDGFCTYCPGAPGSPAGDAAYQRAGHPLPRTTPLSGEDVNLDRSRTPPVAPVIFSCFANPYCHGGAA